MVHYDKKRAELYNSGRRRGHPLHMLPYETWRPLLGDVEGLSVLDLACGDGYTSRVLAGMGANVVGVDISQEQIKWARQFEAQNPLDITYFVDDAAKLKLGRTFDLVCPSFLFHYARDMDTLWRMMERAAAHLKRDGKMVALSAAPQPIVPRFLGASHSTRWGNGDPWHEGSEVVMDFYDLAGVKFGDIQYYYWAPETYERLLQSAGFVGIKWHPNMFPRELRKQFPSWRQMEQFCGSAVLTAQKR
jgi:SAM-dependent methyltransferase